MPCPPYASALGGILVVQSTGRPTGLDTYAGRRIYEADTGRELLYDGTGWIIESEPVNVVTTPATFMTSGVTVGNSTCTMTYRRSDGDCFFDYIWIFGSTSAITGAVIITLPIAGAAVRAGQLLVSYANGAGSQGGLGINAAGTTSVGVLAHGAAGAYISFANLSSLIPFTWDTNSVITLSGRYRMTTRYS